MYPHLQIIHLTWIAYCFCRASLYSNTCHSIIGPFRVLRVAGITTLFFPYANLWLLLILVRYISRRIPTNRCHYSEKMTYGSGQYGQTKSMSPCYWLSHRDCDTESPWPFVIRDVWWNSHSFWSVRDMYGCSTLFWDRTFGDPIHPDCTHLIDDKCLYGDWGPDKRTRANSWHCQVSRGFPYHAQTRS